MHSKYNVLILVLNTILLISCQTEQNQTIKEKINSVSKGFYTDSSFPIGFTESYDLNNKNILAQDNYNSLIIGDMNIVPKSLKSSIDGIMMPYKEVRVKIIYTDRKAAVLHFHVDKVKNEKSNDFSKIGLLAGNTIYYSGGGVYLYSFVPEKINVIDIKKTEKVRLVADSTSEIYLFYRIEKNDFPEAIIWNNNKYQLPKILDYNQNIFSE